MATYTSEETEELVTIECRFCRKFDDRHAPATSLRGQWEGGEFDEDPHWVPVCDDHARCWDHDDDGVERPPKYRLPHFTLMDDR